MIEKDISTHKNIKKRRMGRVRRFPPRPSREHCSKGMINNMALIKPNCLHVPALYEGSEALLKWEAVDGAEQYELYRVLDSSTFIDGTGLPWSEIEYFERSWQGIDESGNTWTMMANIPTGLIYRGPGVRVPGPEPGIDLSWELAEKLWQSWAAFEHDNKTWADMEDPFFEPGISWIVIQKRGYTWAELEAFNKTWANLEQEIYFEPGISWSSAEAYWLTWAQFEALEMTWHDLEQFTKPDIEPHLGHEIITPLNTKTSMFKLRAIGPDGESEFIITAVTPHLARKLIIDAVADRSYYVPLVGEGMTNFIGRKIKVSYDPMVLRLINFAAQMQGIYTETGEIPDTGINIISHSDIDGVITLGFNKEITSGMEWSGLVTLFEFIALESQETTILVA